MKSNIILIIILIHSFCSCSVYKGERLSSLMINAKVRNSHIVNRRPDYGDGHRDGCIIMQEMKVKLVINNDTIKGYALDVLSDKPLVNASVVGKLNSDTVIATALTDGEGKFHFFHSQKVTRLVINSIGYRTFTAKL